MASDVTVGEAIHNYISALKPESRPTMAPELQRFTRWFGPERRMGELTAFILERYQEQMDASGMDSKARLESLRHFLSDARSKKLLDVALANAVKVRRKTAAERASAGAQTAVQTIEMTQTGHDQLQSDLKRLELEERPRVTEQVSRARADGDLRENAPYHAAREGLQEIDRKINEIKETLAAATIAREATGERAGLGTTVVVRDLHDNEELTYTLVGPGDVDRRGGRISIQSPVGQALVDHTVGDTIDVKVPAGNLRYRIEKIERAS